MKKCFVLLILLLMVTGCSQKKEPYHYKLELDDQVIIDKELSIEKVKPGVVVVNHMFPWDANSMIIEMENKEIVLIDTPMKMKQLEK